MTTDEIIQRILPAAVLAPSAHNTQPWKFRVGDDWVEVLIDEPRHLSVSDPTRRELYISLGCVITNIVVAAAKAGLLTQIEYSVGEAAARLRFAPGTVLNHWAELYPAIAARRTNRTMYDAKPLAPEEKAALHAQQDAGVHLVEERAAISELAKFTEQGTVATLSRADFKEELSHWVRNSWTRQPDGMPGYAMGMPAPVSLLAARMVKIMPIHKQEGPKARQEIVSSSAVAVVTTAGDTPADWMRAGQLLEQLWLEATQAGLAAAPLASAIEANLNTREGIKKALNTNHYPQAIIRLGRSNKKGLRATPRRSVGDCLET